MSREKRQAEEGKESTSVLTKFQGKSGDEVYLIPRSSITLTSKNFEGESTALTSMIHFCQNCFRDMFTFNNKPCTVACGHTFCEMCLMNESQVYCIYCKKTLRTNKDYIVNISMMKVYKHFVKRFGFETQLDVYWREIRHSLNTKASMIRSLLHIWEEYYYEGLRFSMSLGFWNQEFVKVTQRLKNVTYPPAMSDDLRKFSELIGKIGTKNSDGFINYCEKRWNEVMKIQRHGLNDTEHFLNAKGVHLSECLYKLGKMYGTIVFEGKRWYFKMSPDYGCVFLHAGVDAKNEDIMNSKVVNISYDIMECKRVFLDIWMRNEGKFKDFPNDVREIRKRVSISLKNSKTDFQERWFHMFLGLRGKTFKNAKITKDKDVVTIEEPEGNPHIFEVPFSDVFQKEKASSPDSLSFGAIVGYREMGLGKLLFLCNNSFKPKQSHYFGNVWSGMDYLLNLNSSVVIEDCGITVPDGYL